MAKVQQISEITPSFAFTEYDFYKDYEDPVNKYQILGIKRQSLNIYILATINVIFQKVMRLTILMVIKQMID